MLMKVLLSHLRENWTNGIEDPPKPPCPFRLGAVLIRGIKLTNMHAYVCHFVGLIIIALATATRYRNHSKHLRVSVDTYP